MAELFDTEASGTDSLVTQESDGPSEAGEGSAPIKEKGGRKTKAFMLTGPFYEGVWGIVDKLPELLRDNGFRAAIQWHCAAEEHGADGYHHMHVVVVLKNTTTIGKINLKRIKDVIGQEKVSYNLEPNLRGDAEVRIPSAFRYQLASMYRENNIRFYG